MAAQPAQKVATNLKRIVPLFNRVLVRKMDPVTESKGGIFLPETKERDKTGRGTIVAVGPGTRSEKGVQIPMSLKIGDEVILPDYGGTKIEVDESTTLFLFKEYDIVAKIEG